MTEPIKEIRVSVLGIEFQAFMPEGETQPVYSQKGVAAGLGIGESSIRSLRASTEFLTLKSGRTSELENSAQALPSNDLSGRILKVKIGKSIQSINVVSSSDLVLIVDILAKRGNTKAQAMTTTSFAIELKRAEDTALDITRPEEQYQVAGKELLDKLEYLNQYNILKQATFEKKLGVPGLSKINKQVSTLAVPDAQQRRLVNKAWRSECTKPEIHKLAIGTIVHQGAIDASNNNKELDSHLPEAARRVIDIYNIIDQPWND